MDDRDGDRPSWDGKHSVPSCLNGLLKDEVAQAEKSLQLQSSLCSGNGKQDLLFFVGLWMWLLGVSSNTTGWRVMSLVPAGKWDISRLDWREESRPTAAKSSGFGKKSPAVIVRDITDHMHAKVYHCSCLFWLAGCRKIKPTQSAQDSDGSVLLISICCSCKGPDLAIPLALHVCDLLPEWWQGLQLRSDYLCAKCFMYKSGEIQTQKELSPVNRFLLLTEHLFMDRLSQRAVRKP